MLSLFWGCKGTTFFPYKLHIYVVSYKKEAKIAVFR